MDFISIIFSTIHLLLSVIPIILHLFGIIILNKRNTYKTNQKYLLVHLSINEILFILSYNVIVVLEMFLPKAIFAHTAWLYITSAIRIPWCNIFISLLIDRFFAIHSNRKHGFNTTRKYKIYAVIGVCWVFGIVMMVPVVFIEHIDCSFVLDNIVLEGYHGLIIIIFIVTYLYIYLKLKNGKCFSPNESKEIKMEAKTTEEVIATDKMIVPQNEEDEDKTSHLIPLAIIFTFIIFSNLPIFIISYVTKMQEDITIVPIMVAGLLFNCGMATDALIYIFLNKSTKRRFLHMIGWRRVANFQNSEMQVQLFTQGHDFYVNE